MTPEQIEKCTTLCHTYNRHTALINAAYEGQFCVTVAEWRGRIFAVDGEIREYFVNILRKEQEELGKELRQLGVEI